MQLIFLFNFRINDGDRVINAVRECIEFEHALDAEWVIINGIFKVFTKKCTFNGKNLIM